MVDAAVLTSTGSRDGERFNACTCWLAPWSPGPFVIVLALGLGRGLSRLSTACWAVSSTAPGSFAFLGCSITPFFFRRGSSMLSSTFPSSCRFLPFDLEVGTGSGIGGDRTSGLDRSSLMGSSWGEGPWGNSSDGAWENPIPASVGARAGVSGRGVECPGPRGAVSLLNRSRHCNGSQAENYGRGLILPTVCPVFPFPIFSLIAFHCFPILFANSTSSLSSSSDHKFLDAFVFDKLFQRSLHWSLVRPGMYSATRTHE